MNRRLFSLLAAIGLAAAALPAAAQNKPTEIRIGVPSAGTGGRPLSGGSIYSTAHLIGTLEDEFKADGIKIKWIFFPGAGPALNEAFANNGVDFGGHGDLPLIVGGSTGLKRKIVLASSRFDDAYLVVPADSQARSLADLKGKRIATFKGTSGQLVLNRVLEKNGFTEKDFKVINLDTETQRAALATKDIDGAIVAPFDLEARGVAKVLLAIKDDRKIVGPGSFWVSEEFEKKYPQITQRVITGLVKAARWGSDEKNREKEFQLWGQAGTVPYIDYVKRWNGWALKDRLSPLLDENYVAAIKRSAEEAKRYKLIRREADVQSWIEPKYLNQALKDLQLEGFWTEFDADGKPKANRVAAGS